MKISKTGTNIKDFERLFRDGNGDIFRSSLRESFSFASQVIQISGEVKPKHSLELWDQAVQYKLAKSIQQEYPFIDNTTCTLEKQNSVYVWKYGFSITSASRTGQRLWTLPDGILKTSNEVISLELDHGDTTGRWANQLIKATRSLASKYIDGVLYCFCMEKNINDSGYLFAEDEHLTDEFLSLLQVNRFDKKLGIFTLLPREWRGKSSFARKEIIDFFESTYIKKKAGPKSKLDAQEILNRL